MLLARYIDGMWATRLNTVHVISVFNINKRTALFLPRCQRIFMRGFSRVFIARGEDNALTRRTREKKNLRYRGYALLEMDKLHSLSFSICRKLFCLSAFTV